MNENVANEPEVDVDLGTEIVNPTADTETVVSTEQIARDMGWVPEAEWRGEPPKHGFISAEEFVENGRRVLPIVNAENRRLKEQLEELKQSVSSIRDGTQQFRKFAEKAIAREREERQKALRQLEKEREEAISNADGAAAVAAEQEINRLRNEDDQANREAEHVLSDKAQMEISNWMADNEWYVKDPDLQAFADGLSPRLKQQNPNLSGKAFLDKLAETVRERMPEKFGNPRASQPSAVEGARRGNPRPSRKRSFDDLPAEAKKEYATFKKSMPDFTKEEYVNLYEWE